MKKIVKIIAFVVVSLFFINSAYSTNVSIYVAGHQQWVHQDENTWELYCVEPFNVTCLIIVINDSGTYVFFDTGGNDPGVQVESNYIEETDENGVKHFIFTPVN